MARRLAPFFAVVVFCTGLVLAYRWVSPDWAAIGGTVSGWLPAAGGLLLWAVFGALVLAAGLAAALWVKANWWRLMLNRPMWMRRY